MQYNDNLSKKINTIYEHSLRCIIKVTLNWMNYHKKKSQLFTKLPKLIIIFNGAN